MQSGAPREATVSMTEPDVAPQCPPHGPYRRHGDHYECVECGEDVGWSPLFGRASKFSVPAHTPEVHAVAPPRDIPDPKPVDVSDSSIVHIDLNRLERLERLVRLEQLGTSDESIDEVCGSDDLVVMRELIYKLQAERENERVTARKGVSDQGRAVAIDEWLTSERDVLHSQIECLMSALAAVLDAT